MRTAAVKQLVHDVLLSMPKPSSEDIIDEVFAAIENKPDWRQRYDDQVVELGREVVNTWTGHWVAHALGKTGLQAVPSTRSRLIASYSKLTKSIAGPGTKRKEPDALQLMSDYYFAHKDEYPQQVRNHRELIVELLMEGLSVEEAFSRVATGVQ